MTVENFQVDQEPTQHFRYLQITDNSFLSDFSSPTLHCFLARNALRLGVSILALGNRSTVLVPAFVCKSAVEGILASGVHVEYYEVSKDLQIDFADLRRKMRPEVGAVMAIHYFGFPAAILELRAFCDEHDIYLIEDCAHVLASPNDGMQLGSIGDIAVFSWRKHLPMYDGATLVLNERYKAAEVEFSQLPRELSRISARFALAANPALSRVYSLLKRFWRNNRGIRGSEETLSIAAEFGPLETSTDNFVPENSRFSMTPASQFILRHAAIDKIIAVRRSNYRYLCEKLSDLSHTYLPFPEPPVNGAAWIFPIYFERHPLVHRAIRQLGIPAVAWDGVRPLGHTAKNQTSDALFDRLAFLPVHQGLKRTDLDKIVAATVEIARQTGN